MGELSAPPDLLVGGEGDDRPLPKNPPMSWPFTPLPSALWVSLSCPAKIPKNIS